MKKPATLLLALFAVSAWAQTYVQPHVTKNGTYVEGHMRSNPNNTTRDNYGTQGNTNPYTGQYGTQQPDYQRPGYQVPTQQTPSTPQCHIAQNGQYICR